MPNTYSKLIDITVPAKDSTANIIMRDVAGNKTDAANAVLAASVSIISWLRGIFQILDICGINSNNNLWASDAIGNKEDSGAGAPGTTYSLMNYIKGMMNVFQRGKVAKNAVDVNAQTDTYEDVINITDMGILTGIFSQVFAAAGVGDPGDGTILITIDGVALTAYTFYTHGISGDGGSTTEYTGQSSLAFHHRFSASLRVQHKKSAANGNIYTTVSYTIN